MPATGDDRGAALVMVLGVMVTVALLGVALVSSTVFASTTSAATRAGVQAQAAAEQAIDHALDQLRALPVGSEGSFPCAIPLTVSGGSATVEVTTTVGYEVAGNAGAYTCPVANGADVTGARLTARATTMVLSASGERELERVVQQVLDTPPPAASDPLLTHGIVSIDGLTMTNSTKISGGGVHTNANFSCNTYVEIDGPVTAVGNGSFTNQCKATDVHIGGNFTCSTSPVIAGDLRVTGAASVTNNCMVHGDFTAGGSITGSGWSSGGLPYNVGGDIRSATGNISVHSSTVIAGNATAAGTILRGSNPLLPSNVQGTVTTGTPTPVPPPPQSVEMPAIHWSDLTGPGAPAPVRFEDWVRASALANGAPAYNSIFSQDCQTVAGPTWSMNGPLVSEPVPMLVDARHCVVHFQALDFELKNDVTLVVKGFTITNGINITSSKPGPDRAKLRIIVVLPEGAPTCSGAGNGTITVNSGGTYSASDVDVLFYTNGKVSMSNVVTMTGSIYTCQSHFSNMLTINYTDMTPPGMDGGGGATYDFGPVARYDLSP